MTALLEDRQDLCHDFVQQVRRQTIDQSAISCLEIEHAWLIEADDTRGFQTREADCETQASRKAAAVVIGKTTGSFVVRLNSLGDTISTGRWPRWSRPSTGSSVTR